MARRRISEPSAPRLAATPTPKDDELLRESPANAVATENGVSVFFSPKGYCTDAIVQQIDKAKSDIKVQAFRLTSLPIAKALVEASRRGVKVSINLDKAQQSPKTSDASYYHALGIVVTIDTRHSAAHNKIILIDDATVITGSFDFSATAEAANAENLLILENMPLVAEAYRVNYEEHVKHSVPYRGPTTAPSSVE